MFRKSLIAFTALAVAASAAGAQPRGPVLGVEDIPQILAAGEAGFDRDYKGRRYTARMIVNDVIDARTLWVESARADYFAVGFTSDGKHVMFAPIQCNAKELGGALVGEIMYVTGTVDNLMGSSIFLEPCEITFTKKLQEPLAEDSVTAQQHRGLTTKELEVRSTCLAHEYAAVNAVSTKLTLDAADDPQTDQASVARAYARDPNWKHTMLAKLSPLERSMLARAIASNETTDTMKAFETRVRKECFATYGMADTFDESVFLEPGKGGWFAVTPPGNDMYWEHRDAQGRIDDTRNDNVPGYPNRDPRPSPAVSAGAASYIGMSKACTQALKRIGVEPVAAEKDKDYGLHFSMPSACSDIKYEHQYVKVNMWHVHELHGERLPFPKKPSEEAK